MNGIKAFAKEKDLGFALSIFCSLGMNVFYRNESKAEV